MFDLAYNLIERYNWLNTLISALTPVAEIDRRLAGINHFSALNRRRFGSPGDCGAVERTAREHSDVVGLGALILGRVLRSPEPFDLAISQLAATAETEFNDSIS